MNVKFISSFFYCILSFLFFPSFSLLLAVYSSLASHLFFPFFSLPNPFWISSPGVKLAYRGHTYFMQVSAFIYYRYIMCRYKFPMMSVISIKLKRYMRDLWNSKNSENQLSLWSTWAIPVQLSWCASGHRRLWRLLLIERRMGGDGSQLLARRSVAILLQGDRGLADGDDGCLLHLHCDHYMLGSSPLEQRTGGWQKYFHSCIQIINQKEAGSAETIWPRRRKEEKESRA